MDLQPNQHLTVGIILNVWPRLSETFILNEIVALERLGGRLRILSIKKNPKDEPVHSKVAQVRALKRMRRRPTLVIASWQQANLFPLYLYYAMLSKLSRLGSSVRPKPGIYGVARWRSGYRGTTTVRYLNNECLTLLASDFRLRAIILKVRPRIVAE